MLDVDRFKSVNDTYGHRTGDEVLQAIATLCRTSLRASDVAGRYGGEEIAILLPETNLADAMRTAERIRQAITQLEFDTKGGPVPVTASLGVATLQTASEEQLEDLLNWADQALYAAKQRGRNQVAIWVPQKPAPE
jgi:diguanylate cyclase (GGDEF)-like protein